MPINGLRHPPAGRTCGWYIWAGEVLSDDPDFFLSRHLDHLGPIVQDLERYLELPPGWRFLIAPHYEDVWFDESLLKITRD